MTNEELKEWFIDKLESCYIVKHDDYPKSIFLYYDESVCRKMKLCKLNNIECKIDKVSGKYIFSFNKELNILFVDYNNIWTFLKNNYYKDDYIIRIFMNNILHEEYKLSEISTTCEWLKYVLKLDEQHKMHVISSIFDPMKLLDY